MSISFTEAKCQDKTEVKLFGLCDDRPNERAYIDEKDGKKWIAVVHNEQLFNVTFTAIDNCVETTRADGTMDSRCDGMLSYNSAVVFIELKERGALGNEWVKDGEQQLRCSIGYFEANVDTDETTGKRAFIANKEHPKFKQTQIRRMEQFLVDTGYVLRVENRIYLT